MNILKTKNYIKSIKSLSKKDILALSNLEKVLSSDIFDSKLHCKKLKGFPDDKVFSFRINLSYRGIFRVEGENIILFAVGHRKDIYQSLE